MLPSNIRAVAVNVFFATTVSLGSLQLARAATTAATTSSVTDAPSADATVISQAAVNAASAAPQYKLEEFASIDDMMPRAIAVSSDNRFFICFPRVESSGPYTVGELKDGKVTPYPSLALNQYDGASTRDKLVSVLAAAVDGKNRLWLLDCGRVNRDWVPGAAKLMAIDLASGAIVKNYSFPADVCLPTTVLKDLRISDKVGADGTAIICDSAPQGKSGLIVVDLATGKSMRRLNGHPTVTAEQDFVVFAEGEMVRVRVSDDNKVDWTAGVTGLALSADQKSLFYSPLAGLSLSSVSIPALCDASAKEADVEKTIKPLNREIGTSDGLESDNQNRLYLTDVENNEIWRRDGNGQLTKLVRDERLIWPDRLCLAPDGYLYVSASQFHRGPWFHFGQDMRKKPFKIYRIKVDAKPVRTP